MVKNRKFRFPLKSALLFLLLLSCLLAFLSSIAASHQEEARIAPMLEEANCYLMAYPDQSARDKRFWLRLADGTDELGLTYIYDTTTSVNSWSKIFDKGSDSLWVSDRGEITKEEIERYLPALRWVNRVYIHEEHELANDVESLARKFPRVNFNTGKIVLAGE